MITIRVNGKPAPQGSKRVFPNGGMVESSKAVGPWRDAVRAETQRAVLGRIRSAQTVAGYPPGWPVMVFVTFLFARPRSHYGTGRNADVLREAAPASPAGKPDLDKLVRAVLDGLVAGGAFADDAQVTELAAVKAYAAHGDTPGAIIEVRTTRLHSVAGIKDADNA